MTIIHTHRQTPIKLSIILARRRTFRHCDLAVSNGGFPTNSEWKPSTPSALRCWENWFEGQRETISWRLELLRAIAPRYERLLITITMNPTKTRIALCWTSASFFPSLWFECPDLRYPVLVQQVLDWLLYLHPPTQRNEFALNFVTTVLMKLISRHLALAIKNYRPEGYLNLWGFRGFSRQCKILWPTDWRYPWRPISMLVVLSQLDWSECLEPIDS